MYYPVVDFFNVYLLELSLSIDNLFVFMLIFKKLSIPSHFQKRVLMYGIVSAIILRIIMIFFGLSLCKRFSFILPFLGVFLLYIGIGSFKKENLSIPGFEWIQKNCVFKNTNAEDFFIKEKGKYYPTQIFFALICVEIADIIFALDSIPAAIGLTKNYTVIALANIASILGLRFLYYKLEEISKKIPSLNNSLGAILIFIGLKMILSLHILPIYNFLIIILCFLIPFLFRFLYSK